LKTTDWDNPASPILESTTMRKQHTLRHYKSKAFTLIEVLLVLAILLVIMGLIVPRLTDRQKDAKIEATKVSIEGLSQALKLYALDHDGDPPRTIDGIKVLLEPNKSDKSWKGPYLERPAVDAWKQPLTYRFPGQRNPKSYDITSPGPDKTLGTPDDIGN
jgi:general secretion pathway protein G